MIKLVLSDMDGTLLNSKKELPKDVKEVFRKLLDKGIGCGIATGRSLASLARDFKGLENELTLVCENGGVVYHKGELLSKFVIDKEYITQIIDEAHALAGTHVVLAALDKTYMLPCSEKQKQDFELYYPNIVFVDDIYTVADEIVKISIHDNMGSEKNSYPALLHFQDVLNVAPSASEWTDISCLGVNKGVGVRVLREKLNLEKEECMAFGDFLNDLTLLSAVGEPYAMANAHPEVKAIARYICESNDKDGVMKTLKTIFEL